MNYTYVVSYARVYERHPPLIHLSELPVSAPYITKKHAYKRDGETRPNEAPVGIEKRKES